MSVGRVTLYVAKTTSFANYLPHLRLPCVASLFLGYGGLMAGPFLLMSKVNLLKALKNKRQK
jgi:hypothetical protein